MSADWTTISSLATAGGTLTLALATFASIRSSNRAARAAERSLLVGLRPVLMSSRPQDVEQKIHYQDDHWVKVVGNGAVAEVADNAIYFAASLRNVGRGLAVLHAWRLYTERVSTEFADAHTDPYHQLTRDLYIAPSDIGYWQGTLRDPSTAEFARVRSAIEKRLTLTIDLMYGDHDGNQLTVTRMALLPRPDGAWWTATSRHWYLDGTRAR